MQIRSLSIRRYRCCEPMPDRLLFEDDRCSPGLGPHHSPPVLDGTVPRVQTRSRQEPGTNYGVSLRHRLDKANGTSYAWSHTGGGTPPLSCRALIRRYVDARWFRTPGIRSADLGHRIRRELASRTGIVSQAGAAPDGIAPDLP